MNLSLLLDAVSTILSDRYGTEIKAREYRKCHMSHTGRSATIFADVLQREATTRAVP